LNFSYFLPFLSTWTRFREVVNYVAFPFEVATPRYFGD
jgi:hypothetical protein